MDLLANIVPYTVEGTFTGYYENFEHNKMKALKVVRHFDEWKNFKMSSESYPYRDEDVENSNKDYFTPQVDEYDDGDTVYSEDPDYEIEYDQSEYSYHLTFRDVHGCRQEYYEHLQAIYDGPWHFNDYTLLYEIYLPEYSRTTINNLPNNLIYLKICGGEFTIHTIKESILYLKHGLDNSSRTYGSVRTPPYLLYGCFSEKCKYYKPKCPKTLLLLDCEYLNVYTKNLRVVYLSCMAPDIVKHHANYENFNLRYLKLYKPKDYCIRWMDFEYVNGYSSYKKHKEILYCMRNSNGKMIVLASKNRGNL
jgi:hypothetical protein